MSLWDFFFLRWTRLYQKGGIKDGKCGLVDADMNIIFEPVYDNIRSNARENNAYLTLNGVKQLVSFDG